VATSDDDEALRLNTLHRFRKHSPRLLLQEYSHCEVPAGCGGVVLRWIDRQGGLPAVVKIAALGTVQCWLDGAPIQSSRIELRAGPHALALEIIALPRANTPILALIDVNLPRDDETLVRSGADERWWTIDSPPSGAWTEPGYDPQRSGWSRALGHSNYEAELPENQRWRWSSLARNARALALPGTQAWLRCEFELSAEAIARRLAAAEERGRA
jgi:hypothetical protein